MFTSNFATRCFLNRLALVGSLVAALAGCSALAYREARSDVIGDYERAGLTAEDIGAARFLFDDFRGLSSDTLESTALPWKLAATALVLERHPGVAPTREHLRETMQEFGFLYSQRIGNWPLAQPPVSDRPLGLVAGQLRSRIPRLELEVVNIGCASCHTARLYDASGEPTDEVWLGLPNTSLDLDAYADAAVRALAALGDDPRQVMDAVRQLYPETTALELATLQRYVWPRLRKRLPQLQADGGALPFRNGGPGRSNGVEAMKHRLGQPAGPGDAASLSIPALTADLRLRSALLADGLYARRDAQRFAAHSIDQGGSAVPLADIVGFFTVSTMGVQPKRVPAMLSHAGEVMAYLDSQERMPLFPGPIDLGKAARGAAIYAEHCASCHGDYVETAQRPSLRRMPNRLTPLERIGTDPERVRSVTPALLDSIGRSTLLVAERQDGYLAPTLSGLWATAPYLHNGSVPTLWHLLHPEARPIRFQVGGHRLDIERVGIAGEADTQRDWRYPADYTPWSMPQWFDTRELGHDNRGHERPFVAMGEGDRDDLLEYLKRL